MGNEMGQGLMLPGTKEKRHGSMLAVMRVRLRTVEMFEVPPS